METENPTETLNITVSSSRIEELLDSFIDSGTKQSSGVIGAPWALYSGLREGLPADLTRADMEKGGSI